MSTAIAKEAMGFAQAVKDHDFDLSSKSLVISSSQDISNVVCKQLATIGTKLRTVDTAKYLGVDISAKTCRSVPQQKCRLERARRRHGKVVKLQFCKPRVHVWRGAVLPQEQYGMLAQGISPTARRRLRGQFATHLGWQAGMCATTLLRSHQVCAHQGGFSVNSAVAFP